MRERENETKIIRYKWSAACVCVRGDSQYDTQPIYALWSSKYQFGWWERQAMCHHSHFRRTTTQNIPISYAKRIFYGLPHVIHSIYSKTQTHMERDRESDIGACLA